MNEYEEVQAKMLLAVLEEVPEEVRVKVLLTGLANFGWQYGTDLLDHLGEGHGYEPQPCPMKNVIAFTQALYKITHQKGPCNAELAGLPIPPAELRA